MKEHKKIMLFVMGLVILKVVFAFLAENYSYFSLRDFLTSVLNTENIVSLTNKSRKAAGLHELKINPKLESAAQKKADDMLKSQYFSHTSASGRIPWDFLEDAGYNYLFAGENLAMNFNSAEEVIEGWLTSLKHKENILDKNYTQIGIGIATGKFLGAKTTIIVQIFGKPLRSSALIGKSKKIHISKRPKRPARLALQTIGAPIVKGASIKKYIAELEDKNLARWNPLAKTHQIYAFPETIIQTKTVLNILLMSILLSGIGIFTYRFFKRKSEKFAAKMTK